ncbi:T9SS type B sorting domain-containing protein [Flavobacterium sp. 20NA77.7]|uniref:T9SS type B sorting domain-containing protein n=1 Tax=Flavobacterium nakdongensis TaxID=3073563 RepID=A0ABY9RAT5_9FLAO|nr:T9SS type B sorting domain-containing protein [Flavobacterium sp. 20NA77.7]WMW77784.1 T9SS type B sorting domain-containing protein [Flavobacterium sp. 20NA77.7]
MNPLKLIHFLFLISFISVAQTPNDCVNAITICGNGTFTSNATGIGSIQEVSGCSGFEHNSIWLKINIINAGTLGFNLLPLNTDINVDYDFWVYGANRSCTNLGSPIRCCTTNPLLAGLTSNATGMIGTTVTTTSGPGANGNGFVRWLNVLPGEFYYIAIDRPVGYGGFQLQWTGSAMDNGGAFPSSPTANSLGEIRACSVTPNVGIFDLNNLKSQINSDLINNSVSFYLTNANAIDGISPLPNIYGNTSNPQTIFARVKNNVSGCFSITSFQLKVYEVPNATINTTTPTICSSENGIISITGTPNSIVEYNINNGTIQTVTLDNSGAATITNPLTITSTFTLTKVKIVDTSNVTLCSRNLNNIVTISIAPNNNASAPSATPSLCINNALVPIIHTTTGATGIGVPINLPTGVTANWSTNTVIISGTPTTSGTFNYTIPLTGGCGNINATGTIIVEPNNSVSFASASPTLCINTVLPSITHSTTGATGIGAPINLPSGVIASWIGNNITISGTPTEIGIFNYSIPILGNCGSINATGTITVIPVNTVTNASATPTLCINSPLSTITHTTTGATGIGTITNLPSGITATWSANTITITGTPTVSGVYNYNIELTGGCGAVTASGIIVVNEVNSVSAPSSSSTVCINNPLTVITHNTTGATGIGIALGLPPGITAIWAANTISISGIPTTTGIFSYSIPLTGGCGNINAIGTIIVNPENIVSQASSMPIICVNSTLPTITHNTIGASGIGTALGLPPGIYATWSANVISINGTANTTGIYTYNIPIIGGCGSIAATGTIEVTDGILPLFAQVAPVCQGSTINIPTISTNGIVGVWQLISSTTNNATYEFTPNPGQCALNTQMTIIIHPLPTVITSITSESFCSGGTTNISLSSNVPGTTFSWTATATSVTGQSDSITGFGATNINQTLILNPSQISNGHVTYVIVAEANGCVGTPVTVVVTVKPIPNVVISPSSQTICSGSTTNISFSGSINNTVYTWSVISNVGVSGALNGTGNAINQTLTTTGLSQGIVIYEVTPSVNGCTGVPQRITVTINPVPELFGNATHPDLCSGESTFISVSAYNSSTIFNWDIFPFGVSGAIAGTSTGSSLSIQQTLTTITDIRGYVDYTITPVLNNCSGTPITIRVYVNPLPKVTLEDGTICVDAAGNTFQTYLLDSGLDNTNYNFLWFFEGNPIANSNHATYVADQVGVYNVVATNSTTNCVSPSVSATITATNPATSFSTTQSDYFSENTTITVTVTGGNGIFMYQLDQGALQQSNVFTAVSSGLHTITVVDVEGCTDLTQELLVIDYPKYFTPNGDGYNDTWNIIGMNQSDAKVFIFDRYGKLIKQLFTDGMGWDGTYNGEILPSTDYWFTVEYKENEIQKQFKAHFSLKR